MTIRRNDPARRHLHDYFLVDGATMRDLAGFATAEEAWGWFQAHFAARRGKLTFLSVVHPAACRCPDVPRAPSDREDDDNEEA